MRLSGSSCRTALTGVAAALALTACGGSDDTPASPSADATGSNATASDPTASAPRSGSAAPGDFCTDAGNVLAELSAAFAGQTDRTAVPPLLERSADRMRTIEPPDVIAGEWRALADGLAGYAAAFEGLDVNDSAAASTFRERTAPLEAELTSAGAGVEKYLGEECGMDLPATGPAAPSS